MKQITTTYEYDEKDRVIKKTVTVTEDIVNIPSIQEVNWDELNKVTCKLTTNVNDIDFIKK